MCIPKTSVSKYAEHFLIFGKCRGEIEPVIVTVFQTAQVKSVVMFSDKANVSDNKKYNSKFAQEVVSEQSAYFETKKNGSVKVNRITGDNGFKSIIHVGTHITAKARPGTTFKASALLTIMDGVNDPHFNWDDLAKQTGIRHIQDPNDFKIYLIKNEFNDAAIRKLFKKHGVNKTNEMLRGNAHNYYTESYIVNCLTKEEFVQKLPMFNSQVFADAKYVNGLTAKPVNSETNHCTQPTRAVLPYDNEDISISFLLDPIDNDRSGKIFERDENGSLQQIANASYPNPNETYFQIPNDGYGLGCDHFDWPERIRLELNTKYKDTENGNLLPVDSVDFKIYYDATVRLNLCLIPQEL